MASREKLFGFLLSGKGQRFSRWTLFGVAAVKGLEFLRRGYPFHVSCIPKVGKSWKEYFLPVSKVHHTGIQSCFPIPFAMFTTIIMTNCQFINDTSTLHCSTLFAYRACSPFWSVTVHFLTTDVFVLVQVTFKRLHVSIFLFRFFEVA